MKQTRDRSQFLLRDRRVCPICKKRFYGATEDWAYKRIRGKDTYNFMCSYHCLQQYDLNNRVLIKEHNRNTKSYIEDMKSHIKDIQSQLEKEEDEEIRYILQDELMYCQFEIENRKY